MEAAPLLFQQIIKGARVKHYPRGQIMLYQGDMPRDVLVLTTGVIKLHDIDGQGNEKILHLVKPCAVVPFAFFAGPASEIQWFYTALTDCDVAVVPAEKLHTQLRDNPAMLIYLMNWFSSEVHELLVRLSSLGKTSAHDKVVAALKFLGVHHATLRRSRWLRVNFAVNHQLIADMTGVTRESTAMTMKELSEHHLIRNPRQTILEINLDRLVEAN
jgi:CRP/FNR family transcriptional regulator, anaerobic regulatory protein